MDGFTVGISVHFIGWGKLRPLFMRTLKALLAVTLSTLMTVESAQAIPYGAPTASPTFSLSIPSSLGYISETHATQSISGGRPDVILIQNLHVNRSVQFAISGILKRLKAQGLMPDHIAMEGATGPVDIAFMQRYPDPVIRKAAADYLVQQGEMPGAIHFAVSEGEGGLFGIETDEYYQANLEMFRRSYQGRAELRQELEKIQAVLPKLEKDPATRQNAAILQKDIDAVSQLINNQVIPDELPATLNRAATAVEHLKLVLPQGTSATLIEPLSASVNFYALALLRNEELFKNTLAVRELGHQKTTIVVTGGFHTQALAQACKRHGLSYAVITPIVSRLDKVDENLYVERLLDHHLTPAQIETGLDWASMGVMAGPSPLGTLEPPDDYVANPAGGAFPAATIAARNESVDSLRTPIGRREAIKLIGLGVACVGVGACSSSSPGVAPSPTPTPGFNIVANGPTGTTATPPSAFAAYTDGLTVPAGVTLEVVFPTNSNGISPYATTNIFWRILPQADYPIAGTNDIGVRFIPVSIPQNGVITLVVNPTEFTGLSPNNFPVEGQVGILSGGEAFGVSLNQPPTATNLDVTYSLIEESRETVNESAKDGSIKTLTTKIRIKLVPKQTPPKNQVPEKPAAPLVKPLAARPTAEVQSKETAPAAKQSLRSSAGFSLVSTLITLSILGLAALASPPLLHAATFTPPAPYTADLMGSLLAPFLKLSPSELFLLVAVFAYLVSALISWDKSEMPVVATIILFVLALEHFDPSGAHLIGGASFIALAAYRFLLGGPHPGRPLGGSGSLRSWVIAALTAGLASHAISLQASGGVPLQAENPLDNLRAPSSGHTLVINPPTAQASAAGPGQADAQPGQAKSAIQLAAEAAAQAPSALTGIVQPKSALQMAAEAAKAGGSALTSAQAARGQRSETAPAGTQPIQTRGDAVEAGALLKSIYRWAKIPGSVSVDIAKKDPKVKEFFDNFEVETDLSGYPTKVTYKGTQIFSVTPVPVGADAYVKKDEGYGIYLGPGVNTLTLDVPGNRFIFRGTVNPTLGDRPVPFGLSPGTRPLDFSVTVITQPRQGAEVRPEIIQMVSDPPGLPVKTILGLVTLMALVLAVLPAGAAIMPGHAIATATGHVTPFLGFGSAGSTALNTTIVTVNAVMNYIQGLAAQSAMFTHLHTLLPNIHFNPLAFEASIFAVVAYPSMSYMVRDRLKNMTSWLMSTAVARAA